eukprot:TRINITY_DN2300_c0_g1_i4.p1 TRINITY_DN2300_c0_g1~~TRINITY_DN2300_c0_g1_i4.p1  ORF type:complete len:222 (-),score=55.14 TRINITY_DN2300_c0_g1_i4:223-888(-)
MSACIDNKENMDSNTIITASEPLCAKRDQSPSTKTSQKHSNREPQAPSPSKEGESKDAGFFEGIYNKVVSLFPNFSLFSAPRSDDKVYSNVDEIVADADSKEQRQDLFDQIKAHKVPLNHVNTEEKTFDLNARKKVLKQITDSPPSLAPVETNDKSAPVIPEQVNLHKLDREPLLDDIVAPHNLHHVSDVDDRSAPVIPSQVNLHKVDREKLLQEIEASAK